MTNTETFLLNQVPPTEAQDNDLASLEVAATYSRPLSGKNITEELLSSDEGIKADIEVERSVSNKEKQDKLEKLRAERFGIAGATVAEFFKEIVATGDEHQRPRLLLDIRPEVLTVFENLSDGPEGPGVYVDVPSDIPQTNVRSFFQGADKALTAAAATWFLDALDSNPRVASWSQRFDAVVKEGDALGLPEFMSSISGNSDDLIPIYPGTGVEQRDGEFLAFTLTDNAGNVPDFYGDMAIVALRIMDTKGMDDEAQRLTVLDDIVLQAMDRSRMHQEKFFRQKEPIYAEEPTLVQRPNGRWELDWDDKVVKSSNNQRTRTQNCPAAYETIEGHSPIKLIGFALNTELAERGFLKVGEVDKLLYFQRELVRKIDDPEAFYN